jgi:hypothetical protein
MIKILVILILISLTGCVNNRWQVPDQSKQEKKDSYIIIQYTF